MKPIGEGLIAPHEHIVLAQRVENLAKDPGGEQACEKPDDDMDREIRAAGRAALTRLRQGGGVGSASAIMAPRYFAML